MNPAHPNLTKVRYLALLPVPVIALLVSAGFGIWGSVWFFIATAVLLALLVWLIWLIPAQVKNLGWQETDDELLLTKGKLWHTFTVIPYGRIQFVDVKGGPIERMFGLNHVELHTASSTSDSIVRGLLIDDASALRDRLAERARERMSGL